VEVTFRHAIHATVIPAVAGMTARCYRRAIPVIQTSTIIAFTSSTEGALREACVEAGRGAAPAGLVTRIRHPGGAGAPPGSTKRPCQELADDRLAYAKRGPPTLFAGEAEH
jgi:hypothetical protein